MTATVGDAAIAVRGRAAAASANEVLVLDATQRPLGWLMTDDIPGEGAITPELADPSSPQMDRRTTLKDALSMLLDQDVQQGVVVDRNGQLRGLLTIGAVMAWMRDERSRATPDVASIETVRATDPDPDDEA